MWEHQHEQSNPFFEIAFTAVIGVLLLLNVLGVLVTVGGWNTCIFLTLVGGYKIFFGAVKGILKGSVTADMAVAIAAVAALSIQQYVAAAEVIFIMLIGEGLEHFAVDRTRGAIAKLMALAPNQARVRKGGTDRLVPIDEVCVGDIVAIFPGERIPVDGTVTEGNSSVDQSAMTGESMPVAKTAGETVLTGTVNGPGALEVRVTAVGHDTKLSEIIHLVHAAEHGKAPVQRRVDRYARYFVPIVLTIAAGTYLVNRWLGFEPSPSIIRAVSVLIIACPCALVLATPTAVVAALGRLARTGILVKGGVHLERAGEATCVVFDKTGTLTLGKPAIAATAVFEEAKDVTEEQLLAWAAGAERNSEHALGALIVETARARGIEACPARNFNALPGIGVEAVVEGQPVLVGGRRLLEARGIALTQAQQQRADHLAEHGYTTVLVARGGVAVGVIAAEDAVRPSAAVAVERLRDHGIRRILMLTGDNERAAARIARQAGIDEYRAGLLPADKTAAVAQLKQEGFCVVMVGDGINDAPALATADVGVAMGGIGTDIAMEAADIVVMTDDPARIAEAIEVARRMRRIILHNIVWFAFVVNALGVVAAATGWASPVVAAVFHQVGSFLVCMNSVRLLVIRKFRETAPGRALARGRAFFEHDLPHLRHRAWHARARLAKYTAALLALAYLASGLYQVAPGETGLERRFGRIVLEAPPGLHYRWPWPCGSVDRVPTGAVQTLEVGFRTVEASSVAEPAAYEWNTRHTAGRMDKRIDEALVLTGDENLAEATLVVQYRIADPRTFRIGLADADKLLRAAAERAFRAVSAENGLDGILATDRAAIERSAAERFRAFLLEYDAGVEVLDVYLQDIHPPLDVVADFRSVSNAFEEKHRLINEAEGYAAEKVEGAKGTAGASLEQAETYRTRRTEEARGAAGKFERTAAAYAQAPGVTRERLYLETVEETLAPVRKVIVDPDRNGTNQLYLYDETGIAAALGEILAPAPVAEVQTLE